jgi:predicted ATPase/DNA-binding SARP family transcriptional activator
VDYRILGPIEVRDDDRVLPLGAGQQRALLALLLLRANETVSRDRLIHDLWGEHPPNTAKKALQGHVSTLRKLLETDRARGAGGRVILTRGSGYELQLEREQLDLARFERLRSEGRGALAQGEPGRAEARLREALALWRGPPLADFAYEPFAQSEIARLEELRVATLEDRFEADLAMGRHGELVGEVEALVQEHPLRERLHGQLMLALYTAGRQAEALEVYQAARQALVEGLGIEPSRQLRELHQAILRQDPGLDSQATAEPAGALVSETPRGVFVGREAEIAQLGAGLEDALAGRGQLFLLVGEPGIGKSHLADELIRHARGRGARVLTGRCWEAGGAPAYWPWVQALRAYIREDEPEALRRQLGAGAADVAQIIPELRELFPDLPEPSLEAEGARFRLFDSAGRFLKDAAAAHPLVLVLDDLHAADEPSLLLLRFVAGELGSSRILVVGTYRDVDPTVRDPLASTLAELARGQVTHRIELSGLTPSDVARYIQLSAGATPAAELNAAIHAETEGNPLFVGEVVRLLAAEQRLADVDVQALWTLGLPQGVREVIGRRLSRLSEDCARVLTLASVLGREFGLDALERLSELHADELLEVLDEAVAARVLAAVPRTHGRLRFAHALIRETVYDGLTTPRRIQLHRRAGEALESYYAQDAEPHVAELAHHFFEAAPGGDVDKALEYARRAGERALKLLGYEEAARFYELSLQALELTHPADQVERCQLLLALGDALAKAGSSSDAKETFLAAAELARTSRLHELLARAAIGYGGRFQWLRAGKDGRLVPLLEEALAALGEDSALRVRLLARLAGALRDQPSLEPRSSLSRQAVEIARRLGDPDTLGYALVNLATATWGPEIEELAEIADEVSRLAEETDDAERAFQACWLHHITSMTLGDHARVAALADEHRALADELKQPSQQWYSAVMRTEWALLRGEFSEGEQLAEEALRLGRRAQSWDADFAYRIALFVLRREQGRLQEIEELIRLSLDEHAGYRCFPALVPVLEWELGREDEARRAFDELAAADLAKLPRDSEWLFSLSLLAETAARLEDCDRAAILYQLLHPYARLNASNSGAGAVGSVARYLAILATTNSRWEDSARHFEDALEVNARMGARPWLAHTQYDYGRMCLARAKPGDRERAQQLLASAETSSRDLGMKALTEKVTAISST